MRSESSVTSVSWIPSEAVSGFMKLGFSTGLSHYDVPPPAEILDVEAMRDNDAFRFANQLSGWAEFDGMRVVDFGQAGGTIMGATTVRMAGLDVTFAAVSMPELRPDPVVGEGFVTFTQTVGGRTALPLPRPVPHPPYVRWQAPLVWTTLAVTLRPDGTSEVELAGASAFPRHWVYGPDGRVTLKSGLADQGRWMAHSFGERTPWADHDRPALVVAVESEVERRLSEDIMRGGARPVVHNLPEGAELTRQGAPGDGLYLVLDGIARVDVDGNPLAELGPGAVLGERALLEGGVRTSTVTAATPLRVAVASKEAIDLDRLRALAESHHREDLVEADSVG